MPYSFTEPVVLQLMSKAHSLVPGISKIVSVYFDPSLGLPSARFIEHPRETSVPEFLDIPPATIELVQKTRCSAKSYQWYKQEEIPFEPEKHREVQMNVFQEMETNVLLVPIESEHDGHSDLLYLYFSDNFSNFKLSNTSKSLMPDHRTIIGNLLYNSLKTIESLSRHDRNILRQVNATTRSVIERYKESQEELKRITSGIQRNIVDICKHLLDEIAANSSIRYSLTTAAAEKLKKFKGEIPELKKILQNAVTFASTLEFEGYREEFKLDEFHINLDSAKNTSSPVENVTMPSARYTKTITLLDKLEMAARMVMERDLPLTGSNVGNACAKSISAPAITDALKKHRNKIITLLNQYPDRWNLIRSEFKPVINILASRIQNNEIKEKSVG
jgi:hypothetical protein